MQSRLSRVLLVKERFNIHFTKYSDMFCKINSVSYFLSATFRKGSVLSLSKLCNWEPSYTGQINKILQ